MKKWQRAQVFLSSTTIAFTSYFMETQSFWWPYLQYKLKYYDTMLLCYKLMTAWNMANQKVERSKSVQFFYYCYCFQNLFNDNLDVLMWQVAKPFWGALC